MKKNRNIRITNLSQVIIGLVLFMMGSMVAGISVYNAFSQITPKYYQLDKGRAISSNEVEFVVSDVTYKIKVSSDRFYVGEIVDIKYNPKKPNECKVVENNTVAVIVGTIAGGIFIIVGMFVCKSGIIFKYKEKSSFEEIE